MNNWLKGILVSNVVGLSLVAFITLVLGDHLNQEPEGGILIFSTFFITPILMGFIAGIFWTMNGNPKWGYVFLHSLSSTVITCIGCIFLVGEGVFCLLIVYPVIYSLFFGGAAIYIAIKKNADKNNAQKLNVSFLGVLVLVLAADIFSKHEFEAMVSDEIIIDASPEQIWPNVVAFEPIKEKPDYWFFQLGMPYPSETTVTENKLGAGRKCIFSNGYTFDEIMTEFEPNKKLTFDITDQPKDPEIMGHFSLSKGQFILEDLGNGKTKLTGNSWYKLYVFPAWYFDLWSEKIVREVHIRVMKNIKTISENKSI